MSIPSKLKVDGVRRSSCTLPPSEGGKSKVDNTPSRNRPLRSALLIPVVLALLSGCASEETGGEKDSESIVKEYIARVEKDRGDAPEDEGGDDEAAKIVERYIRRLEEEGAGGDPEAGKPVEPGEDLGRELSELDRKRREIEKHLAEIDADEKALDEDMEKMRKALESLLEKYDKAFENLTKMAEMEKNRDGK
jgi:chromosome segregation ATPase